MIKKTKIMLLIFLCLFLCLTFINAQSWESYGTTFPQMWHEQFGGLSSRFDLGTTSFNSQDIGQTFKDNSPLVNQFTFSDGTKPYIVIQSENKTYIYSPSNMTLKTTIDCGHNSILSQVDTMDFNGDGRNDIAMVVGLNSTVYQYRVYTLSPSTDLFSLYFSQNITTHEIGTLVSPLRHFSHSSIFALDNNPLVFALINSSTTILQNVSGLADTNKFVEGVSWSDINGDGKTEYLVVSDQGFTIMNDDGTSILNYISPYTYFKSARFYRTGSAWRIAVFDMDNTLGAVNWYLSSLRIDGSTDWSTTAQISNLGFIPSGKMAITDDYNGDSANDIYLVTDFYTSSSTSVYVISGLDGSILKSSVIGQLSSTMIDSFNIADMDNDGYYDFIIGFAVPIGGYSGYNRIFIFNPKQNTTLLDENSSSYISSGVNIKPMSCIPADVNNDGYLEVVCNEQSFLRDYSVAGAVNNAPIINAITFSPSTNVKPSNTVFAIITAQDLEGDQIFYSVKCFNGGSWNPDSLNNIVNCTYGSIGTYNMTIGVKDYLHGYTTYSQTISVSLNGSSTICNFNSICDLGESSVSCPSDCSTTSSTTNGTYSTINIPTEIVNETNPNQGLLPEIYYGLIGFLSYTFYPIMIFVFSVFTVLIVITIFAVIKNLIIKGFGG